MNPRLGIFLDAAVLVAAAGSPTGGSSAAIDTIAGDRRYQAALSPNVLREARRNVDAKLAAPAGPRLVSLLVRLRPTIVRPEAFAGELAIPESVAAKDHHVVRACVAYGATIRLTLDRRHLLIDELRAWGMKRRLFFIRPAEFLHWHRLRDAGI
jgi:hypothetical protein